MPVPLHLDDDGDLAAQLDAAAVQSAAAGHPIKALLFTNPSNPQGIIFSRKRLDAFVAWCLPRGIHLIRCVAPFTRCLLQLVLHGS